METAINFSETATCALFCFTFYCWYMGALPASNTLARTHTRTQLVGGKVKIFNTSHSEYMKSLAMLKLLMSVPNTRVNTRDLLCSMPCSAFVCLQIEYDMYFSIWSYISNSSFFFHSIVIISSFRRTICSVLNVLIQLLVQIRSGKCVLYVINYIAKSDRERERNMSNANIATLCVSNSYAVWTWISFYIFHELKITLLQIDMKPK